MQLGARLPCVLNQAQAGKGQMRMETRRRAQPGTPSVCAGSSRRQLRQRAWIRQIPGAQIHRQLLVRSWTLRAEHWHCESRCKCLVSEPGTQVLQAAAHCTSTCRSAKLLSPKRCMHIHGSFVSSFILAVREADEKLLCNDKGRSRQAHIVNDGPLSLSGRWNRAQTIYRLIFLAVAAGDSEDEDLSELSDVEVSQYLLSAEESKMKETVWTQMNQDYLDAQAIKGAQQAAAAQVRCPTQSTGAQPRSTSPRQHVWRLQIVYCHITLEGAPNQKIRRTFSPCMFSEIKVY